ncbi:hypothetical protein QTL86_02900 [Cellulosilyticum sp. ST5]|uniref:hypothetical protein n=2 Tax=Cellulosilyticum TaxID=698776 RepID=UPI000F8F1B54|nr:hypothetical protein [Cellulosilyticum sp. WCF-2]QEH70051.1 hypothetical protein EKH84_17300 [Cellulosilyticum sp. WCF-2]
MINHFMYMYSTFLVDTFGYDLAVRLEEIFYGLAMFILGAIAMGFLTANFILRLHGLKDFGKGKLRLLRYDNGYKSKEMVTVKNIWSSFQVVLLLSFSPFFTIKRFAERDEKRTKRFVKILFVVVIIILLFAFIASYSVLREPIMQTMNVTI